MDAFHRSPVQAQNGGWPQAKWTTISHSQVNPIENFIELQKRVFSF
jgi:hypothetical protein